MKELIANCFLEDPVYVKWAMENRLGFDFFLSLSKEDVLKVFYELKNADEIFLRALKNHPLEIEFTNKVLPSLILANYMDNRDGARITIALQEDARAKIMNKIYELKENGSLKELEWKLPSSEVLRGTNFTIDGDGNYVQYYENNILAATGKVDDKKLRTGLWKNYYPNGAPYSQGSYIDGDKQGEWVIYYLKGNVKWLGQYKNNLKNGNWHEFEADGELKNVVYLNGKIQAS